ncbi:MAG: cytochrome c nitrite reductase small subunit [Nitrospirota bacterium]
MDGSRSKKVILFIVIAGVAGVAVFLFFLIGPPKLMAKTDEPDFCVKCHVMESQYESWIHAGAHRRKKCVDCHLPHENKGIYYLEKARYWLKTGLVFYSGRVPEEIKVSSRGRKVLQTNCVRCHDITLLPADTERRCWDCHRRVTHKLTGIIKTF